MSIANPPYSRTSIAHPMTYICAANKANVTRFELHNIASMHHSQQSFETIHFASFRPDRRRRPGYRCCRGPAARTARRSTIGFDLCPSCSPRGRFRDYRVSPGSSSSTFYRRRKTFDHVIPRSCTIIMKLIVGNVDRSCGVSAPGCVISS